MFKELSASPFLPFSAQQSWDLNTLIAPGSGWFLTSATDINDAGQIVGTASDSLGGLHYYLLTPTPTPAPEPSSWLMLASGVLAFGLRKLVGRSRSDQVGSPRA